MKTSAKLNAQYLGQLLKQHKCKSVVIAPGSRNAPLIITFDQDKDYRCISVPDERAAAFTAMGMTLENKEPVAVICSSGSATVNFFPAVAEAYYQKLPLIVITSDRPKELVDQGVGQTMRQEGVFGSHVVKEANLHRDPHDHLAKAYNQRLINEALLASEKGPVHINVPFDEPLYETVEAYSEEVKAISRITSRHVPDISGIAKIWNESKNVMLLTGQMEGSEALEKAMDLVNERSAYLVLSETVSNVHASCSVESIDRLINTISDAEKKLLRPDLLITMGGEVVSKMVKEFLKEYPPKQHWHLSRDGEIRDTFQFLSTVIESDETVFFNELLQQVRKKDRKYCDFWIETNERKRDLHNEYLLNAEFSDLVAYRRVLDAMPKESIIHSANSASIRYSQLFDHPQDSKHYGNRGTSGIDGCTSTAIGHAMCTDKLVTLFTGDVAFLYDSNAFWNDELPANLRVVIMNNNGGNIFRIIKGPDGTEMFERFQETVHQVNLRGVADTYGLVFTSVDNEAELTAALPRFYEKTDKPALLEIKTPRIESPKVLEGYFEFLRKNS